MEEEQKKQNFEIEWNGGECYGEENKSFNLKQIIGLKNDQRNNFLFLETTKILVYSGQYYSIYDLAENKETSFKSVCGGGIGAIDAHISKQYFAIGEKGKSPSIVIMEYPKLTAASILRNGAEEAYSSVNFSKTSDKLVSVATKPDYSIVIWNWKKEQIILKAKAFSQEIYKVMFSDFTDEILCSSGLAHIKFWKIAQTFTGLKLKGDVGKFGIVELSDINDFVIFSDEYVLSGSEMGNMMLWEGNFIKLIITQPEGKKCHNGSIDCVRLYEEYIVITASRDDSQIKFWSVDDIKALESEESIYAPLIPSAIIETGMGTGFLNLDTSFFESGRIFAQCTSHQLIQISFKNYDPSKPLSGQLSQMHFQTKTILAHMSAKMNNFEIVNNDHLAIACNDGYVQKYSSTLQTNQMLKLDNFNINALAINDSHTIIVIGNNAGIVKSYDYDIMELISIYRIFEQPLRNIQIDGKCVVCQSDNFIFFLALDLGGNLKPIYQYEHPLCSIIDIKIRKGYLFFSNAQGFIKGLVMPNMDNPLISDDYDMPNAKIVFSQQLRMMEFQKPKQDEDDIKYYLNDNLEFQDVEWDYRPISSFEVNLSVKKQAPSLIPSVEITENLSDILNTKILVSANEEYVGYIYLIDLGCGPLEQEANKDLITKAQEKKRQKRRPSFRQIAPNDAGIGEDMTKINEDPLIIQRPEFAYKTRKCQITIIQYDTNKELLLLGYFDGMVSVRQQFSPQEEIGRIRCHDKDIGRVLQMVYNTKSNQFISLGGDGTLAFFGDEAVEGVRWDEEDSDSTPLPKEQAHTLIRTKVNVLTLSENEITLATKYALKRDKQQSHQDMIKQQMLEKKKQMENRLKVIRQTYFEIKAVNKQAPKYLQICENDIEFSQQDLEKMGKDFTEEVEEVIKEQEYDLLLEQKKLKKASKFFLEESQGPIFMVSKFINLQQYVETIKMKFIKQENNILQEKYGNEALFDDEGQQGREQKDKLQSTAKELISQLNILRKKLNDNKTKDYYQQMKKQIKEQCQQYDTVDQLRREMDLCTQELAKLISQSTKKNDNTIEDTDQFGQLILKSQKDYQVPDDQIIDQKRLEIMMFLIEKFQNETAQDFNDSLINLRQQKLQLFEEMIAVNQKLSEINTQSPQEQIPLFSFKWDFVKEFPLLRLKTDVSELESIITDNGLIQNDEAQLQKNILKEIVQDRKLHQLSDKYLGTSDSGNAILKYKFIDKVRQQDDLKLAQHVIRKQEEVPITQQAKLSNGKADTVDKLGIRNLINEQRQNRLTNSNNTRVESYRRQQRLKMQMEAKLIQKGFSKKIEAFDQKIDKMIIQRSEIEWELKLAQQRALELHRQSIEIMIFEDEDREYKRDLCEKKKILSEHNEKRLTNLIHEKEILIKLEKTEQELKNIEEKYKEKIFPSEPEKQDFVYKYFSYNYKKSQSDQNTNFEENKEYDASYMDPEKKDWIIFFEQNEEWMELFKKRYDMDELLKQQRKVKKTNEIENQKNSDLAKQWQYQLIETKQKYDALQLLKYQRIGRILTSVPVDYRQVTLDIPLKNIQNVILTQNNIFTSLIHKSEQLEHDCKKYEKERNELCSSETALIKSLNIAKQAKKHVKEELEENFKLKFGEVIDLSLLDQLKETKRMRELKMETREAEKSAKIREAEALASLQQTEAQLTLHKKDNTNIIKKLSNLGIAQTKLNKALDNTNKQIFKEDQENELQNITNTKEELIGIISLLSKELMDLKNEIKKLKLK